MEIETTNTSLISCHMDKGLRETLRRSQKRKGLWSSCIRIAKLSFCAGWSLLALGTQFAFDQSAWAFPNPLSALLATLTCGHRPQRPPGPPRCFLRVSESAKSCFAALDVFICFPRAASAGPDCTNNVVCVSKPIVVLTHTHHGRPDPGTLTVL